MIITNYRVLANRVITPKTTRAIGKARPIWELAPLPMGLMGISGIGM